MIKKNLSMCIFMPAIFHKKIKKTKDTVMPNYQEKYGGVCSYCRTRKYQLPYKVAKSYDCIQNIDLGNRPIIFTYKKTLKLEHILCRHIFLQNHISYLNGSTKH